MTRSFVDARFLAVVGIPLILAACGAPESGDAAPEPDAAAEAEAEALEVRAAPVVATPANANEAEAEALEALLAEQPGAAEAILAGRPFARPGDLHAALVQAVGEEAARSVYAATWVPLDLNDATTEEILLIPGVGDRMAHEFEEYRPYVDMDQFRREIGKYVDEEEVARLESYVTIR